MIFLEHENRICKIIHCVTSRSHLTFKGKWENAWINIRNELVRGGDLWNYSYTPIQFYFISSVASVLCHYLLSIVFLLFQIIKLSLKSWSKWLQQWKSNLGVSFTLKAGSIEYNNSHMIFNEKVQKFRCELSYYWVCVYNFSHVKISYFLLHKMFQKLDIGHLISIQTYILEVWSLLL